MQSKTSFFNKTIFRKHIARFWPVWGAYFGIWLLALPVSMLASHRSMAENALSVQSGVLDAAGGLGVVLPMIFAVFAAMGVWSFLYSSRSASGAACLPVTRTAQFFSAALGGFVPLAAAHVLIFLLTALAELSLGALHLPSLLTWLGVTLLTLLHYYGFACFCAMLTGNIIVLPAVYVVLSFTAVAVEALLNGLANWFLYGLDGAAWSGFASVMNYLSPTVVLLRFMGSDMITETVTDAATGAIAVVPVGVRFTGWGFALAYAAVGALLLWAALALLRRRQMETAGDVVAVQPLKPVFRWCMGVGVGLCFACAMLYVFRLTGTTQREVFLLTALYLAIGGFLGWFAAEMLIRRSFRVFRGGWRGWGGWALCCAVLLIGLTVLETDLAGAERRQPKAERIERVVIHAGGQSAFLETPEGVAAAMELHRAVIAHKATQDQCSQMKFFEREFLRGTDASEWVSFNVDYLFKGGDTLSRSYVLPHAPGAQDDAAAAQALLNCPEAVQARKETPFPFTADNVRFGTVRAVMTAAECAAAAGYDDPAEYILREQMGWAPQQAAALGEAERAAEIAAFLRDAELYAPRYSDGAAAEYYAKTFTDQALPAPDASDWDKVWLEYTLELSADDAWALYDACIRPDNAEGTLGRVWILTGEPDYANTACAGSIEIVAQQPAAQRPQSAPQMDISTRPAATAEYNGGYRSFTTTPTVDAQRTRAFLEARGIRLHTPAELRAAG